VIKKLVKYAGIEREAVIVENADIDHDCPCQVGVIVRFCVKCRTAYDDPTEWDADDHQAEQGHWVPSCLFCQSCEELIFEGFDTKGPFCFFVVNLKEGLRLIETNHNLRLLGIRVV
jgi:hypothetical protein